MRSLSTLQKLNRIFADLPRGFNRINPDVCNSEDRQKGKKESEERREQIIEKSKKQGVGA